MLPLARAFSRPPLQQRQFFSKAKEKVVSEAKPSRGQRVKQWCGAKKDKLVNYLGMVKTDYVDALKEAKELSWQNTLEEARGTKGLSWLHTL